jgi:hypothetical protein
MVSVNVSYPDFSAGEISPKMYGRHDLAAFYNGGRRVENFITEVAGMARFRTGSIYSAKTQNNEVAFLYTFNFSESLSFILEFTDQKLRFYRSSGRVHETAQAITGATAANPVVITYDGADNYSNGDSVFITGIVGMTELNGNDYTVANVNAGANTFELSGVDGSAFTAYVSGGSVAVITEVTTPFAAADLPKLKFSPVVNGIMYIAHPSYNPQALAFTSATNWGMTNHSPTALTLTANNRPSAVGVYEQRLIYAGSNNNPNRMWFSKSGDFGNFTTGTAVTDGISYSIAGSVGRILWLAGTSDFLAIGTLEDVFQATGGIDDVITVDSISIKPTNSFGVSDMMPIDKGNQILYTQSNNLILRSFEYDVAADGYRPIDRNTIADHITSSGLKQIAYQEGRPNIMWAVKNNGVLTGMTIEDSESVSGWHRHTSDGDIKSVATLPRANDYNQLWQCVERTINGSTVRYIEFYSDIVNYVRREDYITGTDAAAKAADDATYSNLLFESQKEYIHLDSSISYYGDELGLNAGATLTPSATTGTGITFTASAAVFDATVVGRELWRKSVTGAEIGRAEITAYTSSTVVTCTVLEGFDSTTAIPAGEWYLTAGSLTGLDHLEGAEVSIVTDGGQHDPKTVTNGAITLDEQASVVHIGLPYTGYLETNDLEGGGTNGVAQTKKKNVHAVGFRFLDTLYAKYGTSYYKLNQIEMRNANMRMDRPPLMFTGDVKEVYANESSDDNDGGWSRQKRVIVSQDQPFPCNVQLIIPYMSVSN